MTIPVKKLQRILTHVALGKPLPDFDVHCHNRCLRERWESVEAMLQWLVAEKYAECARTKCALKNAGSLYPLPKPTNGVPEGFAKAFPGAAWDERILSTAFRSLDGMERALEKAEAALHQDDHPKAIWWLDRASGSWHSALALWNSGSAVRVWRYVEKHRSTNADNRRGKKKTAPTPEKLAKYRDAYIADHDNDWGWKTTAAKHFRISIPTITKIVGPSRAPARPRGFKRMTK